jgi:adenosine deaminase
MMNELHLHIDGSIRKSTLQEWCPELRVHSFGFQRGMTLEQCLSCFTTTVTAINSAERMQRVVSEICEDQSRIGVQRTELRFAPHIHGVNTLEMVDAATKGLDEHTNLILCGLYGESPKTFETLVEIAKKNKKVVGIDIAGGPRKTDKYGLHHYVDAYQEAKLHNIGRTAHVGEGRPPSEIVDAILMLDLQRLGHACTLLESQRALELVLDRSIVIEACPTSNTHTGIYKLPSEHPIKQWIEKGVRVSICADNSLMSNTNTVSELWSTRFFSGLLDRDIKWIEESSRLGLFWRKNYEEVDPTLAPVMF